MKITKLNKFAKINQYGNPINIKINKHKIPSIRRLNKSFFSDKNAKLQFEQFNPIFKIFNTSPLLYKKLSLKCQNYIKTNSNFKIPSFDRIIEKYTLRKKKEIIHKKAFSTSNSCKLKNKRLNITKGLTLIKKSLYTKLNCSVTNKYNKAANNISSIAFCKKANISINLKHSIYSDYFNKSSFSKILDITLPSIMIQKNNIITNELVGFK